jgi:2Fe-2S ferredoxin
MPTYKVIFEPAGVSVDADPAKYPYGHNGRPGSVLDIALSHGVLIEHTCGGVGACSTCHVIIRKGMENLSPAEDEELDRVDLAPGNTIDSRLACQAVVRGDVTVMVPAWNRNLASEGAAGSD